MTTVLIVLGIPLVVGLILVLVLVPVFRRLRRTAREHLDDLRAELERTGEQIVIAPQSGNYRGGTGSFGKVKGNGTILLTDRRLLFRKLSGGEVEVPRSSITGVSTAKVFLGARVGGQTHLVVDTDGPAQVGFYVTDLDAWVTALQG